MNSSPEDSTTDAEPSPEQLEAVERYLFVLNNAGRAGSTTDQDELRRHIAQLVPLLPAGILSDLIHQDPGTAASNWTFKPGAGERLVTWWRRQDPLPATLYNERLLEHVRRVEYAERHFADERSLPGFDDRGRTYVRFGEPGRRHEIRFNDGRFLKEVVGRGVHVTTREFPENEFWFYPRVDPSCYFLFIKDGAGYRLGSSDDLLPPSLRNHLTVTRRDLNIAVTALAALRHVYGQMAMLHPDFAGRHALVESYALWQEHQQMAAETGGAAGTVERVRVGIGFGEERIVFAEPAMGIAYPNDFVHNVLEQSRREDAQLSYRREQALPQQFFNPFSESEEALDVALRTARFLDEDGTTRTELYWSPLPGALGSGPTQAKALEAASDLTERYILRTTVAQQDGTYRTRVVNVSHAVANAASNATRLRVPLHTAVVKGDTGLYNLSVQLDQFAGLTTPGSPDSLAVGPRLKLAVLKIDSLRALRSGGRGLEVSDIQPVLVPPVAAVAGIDFLDEAVRVPYPFTHIPSDAQLVLYFEIYHLSAGSDGRTRYTIEYELNRRASRSGLRRLFGTEVGETTAASSTYEGVESTSREYILLDLNEFQGVGVLRITLRVRDEETGRQVERGITFQTVRR